VIDNEYRGVEDNPERLELGAEFNPRNKKYYSPAKIILFQVK